MQPVDIPVGEIPALGLCAYSGVGKTSLLEKLLPLLRERNLQVGLLKHSHHALTFDQTGKDSQRLAAAGANPVLLASDQQQVLIQKTNRAADFKQLLDKLRRAVPSLDLILVEGFKQQPFPKIELYRPVLQHPLLAANDPNIIAVAADAPLPVAVKIPVLDLHYPQQIADFICLSFLHW